MTSTACARTRKAGAAVALAAVVAAAGATVAQGAYGPGAEPASATATRLGDRDSNRPLLAGSGRYVVFTTAATLLLGEPADSGLVRKDLAGGAVELVAPITSAAQTASVSDDGRYVMFDTVAALLPGDGNRASDVYVRDMTRALTDVGAYELVSALDAGTRAPAYRNNALGSLAGNAGFGLSDDGRTAVFWASGPSNLLGGSTITPARQVFVRSLDTLQTRLVTRDKDDPSLPGTPVAPLVTDAPAAGPVLSGDGRTVAWLDVAAARQARFLPSEQPSAGHYLWRDMAAGPGALARRITGVSDPDDPGCDTSLPYVADELALGPCYGPLASGEAVDPGTPTIAAFPLAISDDGRRVLVKSGARLRPFDPAAQREGSVYLADMTAGRSRKDGTRRVVSVAAAVANLGRDIQESALSGDGRKVVFTSRGNTFDDLRPVGPFQTTELVATNAFTIDLEAGSVERVTRGADGSDYVGPPLSSQPGSGTRDPALTQPSVDDQGAAIAFAAGDGNLFVGDVNGVSDVQVVRVATPAAVGVQTPVLPDAAPAETADALASTVLAPLPPVHPVIGYVELGPKGVAKITVRVPAAGTLTAEATRRPGGRKVKVARAKRTVTRATRVTLRLRPTKATVRAVRRARRGVAVAVLVRYMPATGASTTATRRYSLTRSAVR